jgi:hypothetical protein
MLINLFVSVHSEVCELFSTRFCSSESIVIIHLQNGLGGLRIFIIAGVSNIILKVVVIYIIF